MFTSPCLLINRQMDELTVGFVKTSSVLLVGRSLNVFVAPSFTENYSVLCSLDVHGREECGQSSSRLD